MSCAAGSAPSAIVQTVGSGGDYIFDVTDPVHPRAVCTIAFTDARIVDNTAIEYLVPRSDGTTDVVLHSLQTNSETIATNIKADLRGANTAVSWNATATAIAYLTDGGTDANGIALVDYWIATSTSTKKLGAYSVPGVDAFARPGLPPPVLALSPDGQYLAVGWALGRSGNLIRVFRLSDHADVTPNEPADLWSTIWSATGHTLYVIGRAEVQVWTPGSGPTQLPNTAGWLLQPNFAPGGAQVAYTALDSTDNVRPTVYDLAAKTARIVIDKPRSSAIFVKAGWMWMEEEVACTASSNQACFDPTVPDGKVLALNLATGSESLVVFGTAGSAVQPPNTYFARVDLWPA